MNPIMKALEKIMSGEEMQDKKGVSIIIIKNSGGKEIEEPMEDDDSMPEKYCTDCGKLESKCEC